jgi:hypothetical protein
MGVISMLIYVAISQYSNIGNSNLKAGAYWSLPEPKSTERDRIALDIHLAPPGNGSLSRNDCQCPSDVLTSDDGIKERRSVVLR